MPLSLLELEERFAQLKRGFFENVSSDVKLLTLESLYQELQHFRSHKQYSSFFSEFDSLLADVSVNPETFVDCSLAELDALNEFFLAKDNALNARHVSLEKAQKLCYVGEIESAAQICAGLAGENFNEEHLSQELNSIASSAEFTLLETAVNHLQNRAPNTALALGAIREEWRGRLDQLLHDQANCLLVEMPHVLSQPRGRLKALRGKIELLNKSAAEHAGSIDELTFNNQLRGSDDPIVGVVYKSLSAVRRLLNLDRLGHGLSRSGFRARYEIANIDSSLTGASVGLAAGVIAFTNLLQRETLRHERFITGEVCFTGVLKENGAVNQVSETTLLAKLERAFFSHVRSVILPNAQIDQAGSIMQGLRKQYPRRRMRIVGAVTLRDVVDDLNIVRAEKVCLGQFVARRVVKYSRATKVQVPLLVALLWVLLALLLPRFFDPWFDDNPCFLRLIEKGFESLNADSVYLWSKEFECDSITQITQWKIGDLDNDMQSEIAIVLGTGSPCEINANLLVYDHNGKLSFKRDCVIEGQYPGDTSRSQLYSPCPVDFVVVDGKTSIVTRVAKSFPSRTHLKFWSSSGDLLGWYINAGSVGQLSTFLTTGGSAQLQFIGLNNRVGCVSFFAVSLDSITGASPPYTDARYSLDKVKRGTQLCYILFPVSDLNKTLNYPYNTPFKIVVESDEVISVQVDEAPRESGNCIILYELNENMRVTEVLISDRFKEIWNSVFRDTSLTSAQDWNSYADELRDAVTYWTDSDWVTEKQFRVIENK